eukprot:1157145-Pyramimonas_sp.AAC.1
MHTQTFSYSYLLILKLTHTQTYTYTDLLIHRLTHTHICSYPYVLTHRLTHTQTHTYSDLLIVRVTQRISECEDVSGGALVSAPLRGAARRYITGPFAVNLRGCLMQFARFRAQHPWRSSQLVRMFQAGRWFQRP